MPPVRTLATGNDEGAELTRVFGPFALLRVTQVFCPAPRSPADNCPAALPPRLFACGGLLEDRPYRRDDRLIRIPDHREHDPVMDRIDLEHLQL